MVDRRRRDEQRRRDKDLNQLLLRLHLILVIIIRFILIRLSRFFMKIRLHGTMSRLLSGTAVRTSAHRFRLLPRLL